MDKLSSLLRHVPGRKGRAPAMPLVFGGMKRKFFFNMLVNSIWSTVSMSVVVSMKGKAPAAFCLGVFHQLSQLAQLTDMLQLQVDVAQQSLPAYIDWSVISSQSLNGVANRLLSQSGSLPQLAGLPQALSSWTMLCFITAAPAAAPLHSLVSPLSSRREKTLASAGKPARANPLWPTSCSLWVH